MKDPAAEWGVLLLAALALLGLYGWRRWRSRPLAQPEPGPVPEPVPARRFESAAECAAAIAMALHESVLFQGWNELQLRLLRFDVDHLAFSLSCYVQGRRHELRLSETLLDWVDQLLQLADAEGAASVTRLALDVDAEGGYDVRYGHQPVQADDGRRLATHALPPGYWP